MAECPPWMNCSGNILMQLSPDHFWLNTSFDRMWLWAVMLMLMRSFLPPLGDFNWLWHLFSWVLACINVLTRLCVEHQTTASSRKPTRRVLFSNPIRFIGLFATKFRLIHQKVKYSLRNYQYGDCHDFCLLFQVGECIGSLNPPKSFWHPFLFSCFFSFQEKIKSTIVSRPPPAVSFPVVSCPRRSSRYFLSSSRIPLLRSEPSPFVLFYTVCLICHRVCVCL